MQIWDTTKEGGKWKLGADKGSGGLWNNGPKGTKGRDPLAHADKPFGQWNQFHIIMKGDLVTIRLNQKLVVHRAPLINYWDKLNYQRGNHSSAKDRSNFKRTAEKLAGGIFL